MVAEAVGRMEVEEDNIMEEEEEEKLHNNKLYKDSVEEERMLFKKFVSISKLCSGDTAKIPCPPWLASADQVDGESRTIAVGVLKRLIGRLETEENPMNIIPVAVARKTDRQSLYNVLDEVSPDGFMSYNDFKQFIQQTDATKDPSRTRLVKYFEAMALGKKIVKWPPPMFIPMISFVQIVFFFSSSSSSAHVEILQFDTDCTLRHWWSYLTYSLLHLETGHLLLNMGLQLPVGTSLEMIHGTKRVIPLYVLGVLSGSLAFFCFDCGKMIGASGGLYCLVAASISTWILNWKEDAAIFFTRFRSDKAPHACGGKLTRILKMTGVLAFFALDFGYAAYKRYTDANAAARSGTSVIAHTGGSVTGILLGFIILKNIKVEKWEKTVKVVSSSLFFFLLGLAFGVNFTGSRRAANFFSPYHQCANSTRECLG